MSQLDSFVPINCQIALFFSPGYQFKNLVVASKINDKFVDVFSQEPSVNNFPSNIPVPEEMPRIVLQEDKIGQIIITANRADLVINISETQKLDNIPDHMEKFASCFNVGQIIRMGLICNYKTNKNVVDIKKRYIIDGKLSGINGMLLGWIKKITIKNEEINQFVNFNLIEPTINETIVTVDHNTTQGKLLRFTEASELKELSQDIMRQVGDDINGLLEWSEK